jgi:hypothetical protein
VHDTFRYLNYVIIGLRIDELDGSAISTLQRAKLSNVDQLMGDQKFII